MILLCLAPLFRLLGAFYRSVAQQWSVPACSGDVFNKPLSSSGLLRQYYFGILMGALTLQLTFFILFLFKI
jgi:hypothetical protein